MKVALVLLFCVAGNLGGVSIERFDPCIFIDCTKFTTPPNIIATTKPTKATSNIQEAEELDKIEHQLVCIKINVYVNC